MDIEQLKLVLQSLDGVTEGAKQIGIGWLAVGLAKDLGYGAISFYVISRIYKAVLAIVEVTRLSGEANDRLRQIRDILVPEYAGTGVVTHGEFRTMLFRAAPKTA